MLSPQNHGLRPQPSFQTDRKHIATSSIRIITTESIEVRSCMRVVGVIQCGAFLLACVHHVYP